MQYAERAPEHKYVRVAFIIPRAEFETRFDQDNYRQVTANDAEIDFQVVGYEDTYVPTREHYDSAS